MNNRRRDPKHLVVPARFYEKKLEKETEEPHRFKSIMRLFEVEYSINIQANNEIEENHNLLKATREYIKQEIAFYGFIHDHSNICVFARKDQLAFINQMLQDIREDYRFEESLFNKKINIYETLMGISEDETAPNCWIFLKENFIIFDKEHEEKIRNFFFG